MTRWLLAARLARREVRRHLARSLLVVAIIALPVLAAQSIAIATRSHQVVPPEVGRASFDGADPAFLDADASTGFDPRFPHPPPVEGATRVESSFSLRDWVEGEPGTGEGPDDLTQVGIAPYVDEGSGVELHAGRLPETRHEVVIGSDLATATGTRPGDGLSLLASDVTLEVVGVSAPVEVHGTGGDDRATTVWVGPPAGSDDDWVPAAVVRIRDSETTLAAAEMFDLYWHGGTAPTTPDASVPRTNPLARVDRRSAADVLTGTAVATIAVGLVAITCSAAFAISARRQLRQLGTLAASGAAPADLRRAVLLQGTVLGAVGAAVATLVTYALRAVVGQRVVDGLHDTDAVLPTAVPEVLGVALLGVAAGTLAALVPAVTASRIPVLRALAGRRPSAGRRGLAVSIVGAGVLATGLGLLSWATAEPGGESQPSRGAPVAVAVLLTMAGAVALAPALVAGAAAVAARIRGTAHLAGRNLARGGLRSSAVVASTAAVLALPVILLVWTNQEEVQSGPPNTEAADLQAAVDDAGQGTAAVWLGGFPDAVDPAMARAEAILGDGTVRGRPVVVGHVGDSGYAVDPERLRAVGEGHLADLLDQGRLVRLGLTRAEMDSYLGEPPDTWFATDEEVRAAIDPPEALVDPDDLTPLGLVLLARSGRGLVADDLAPPVEHGTTQVLLRPGPLTSVERNAVLALRADPAPTAEQVRALHRGATPTTVSVDVSGSADEGADVPVEAVVLGLSVLLALAVIATSLALAATDGRGDELVVAAAGAPPATVRRRRALEAGLTAACAALLGGGVGAVATLVVIHNPGIPTDPVAPHTFPFVPVTALAVGVVALVGLVTWAVLTASDRLRGRRDLVLVDL